MILIALVPLVIAASLLDLQAALRISNAAMEICT